MKVPSVIPDWHEFKPTSAAFVLLFLYVVIVTSILDDVGGGPNGGVLRNKTVEESWHKMGMYMSVNPDVDACQDFAGHACGRYFDVYPIESFSSANQMELRSIQTSTDYASCMRFTDWTTVDDFHDQMTLKLTDEIVRSGLTVNGLVVRVYPWKGDKRYRAHLLFEDDDLNGDRTGRLDRCGCLEFDTVIHNDTACDVLCDTTEDHNVTMPKDFPGDCNDALIQFRMRATSAGFNATDCSIVRQRSERLISAAMQIVEESDVGGSGGAEGIVSSQRPLVNVCGGIGMTDDVEWADHIEQMWSIRRLDEFDLIGNVINRAAWPMSGHTVNAVYVEEQDSIFVMGSLFRPPFFDSAWSEELLLGGLDFIIAHELGHAIDSRLNDSAFGNSIIDRISRKTNVNSTNISVTVHEDMADTYGMQILERVASPTLTTFYQFAQIFCSKSSDFSGDVHAPGAWRVNQTVLSSPTWGRLVCNGTIPDRRRKHLQ